MEALNALFRKADEHEILQPIGHRAMHHRASLYVDDIVLFVSPVAQDLQMLNGILDCFWGASGLATKLAKVPSRSNPVRWGAYPTGALPVPVRHL